MKINDICNEESDRTSFNRAFLYESPEKMQFNSWPGIKNIVLEIIKIYPENVIVLNMDLKKLELPNNIYYWVEKNDKIVLAVTLEKQKYAYIVRMVGKDPNLFGVPPFSSDLYLSILKDCMHNICLRSDKTLSEDGFKIWEKLFDTGHKISLYDKNNPGQTFKHFKSFDEMKKYFGVGKNYQDYQYVLSESAKNFAEAFSYFSLRKVREENNLPLD
jgi:hypothetical protein